jgi:hypothetical protein
VFLQVLGSGIAKNQALHIKLSGMFVGEHSMLPPQSTSVNRLGVDTNLCYWREDSILPYKNIVHFYCL